MALFKIFKGLKENLPATYKDGFCYVTIDDGKMYIDTKDDDAEGRIVLNAAKADFANVAANLNNISTAVNVPGYFTNGIPSPVASIPGSLVTDLSDKYLSVTKGGTVNGNVTDNTFTGKLYGEADTALHAENADVATTAFESEAAFRTT